MAISLDCPSGVGGSTQLSGAALWGMPWDHGWGRDRLDSAEAPRSGCRQRQPLFPQADEPAPTGETQSLPKPVKLHENNEMIEVRNSRTESRLRASNGCPELGQLPGQLGVGGRSSRRPGHQRRKRWKCAGLGWFESGFPDSDTAEEEICESCARECARMPVSHHPVVVSLTCAPWRGRVPVVLTNVALQRGIGRETGLESAKGISSSARGR